MPAGYKTEDFTTDKAVLEALTDRDKLMLLAYFMSNKTGFSIDWDLASKRYGCKASSMAVTTPKVLAKIKTGALAAASASTASSGTSVAPKNTSKKNTPKTTPAKKAASASKKRVFEDDDDVAAATPTPSKMRKREAPPTEEVDDDFFAGHDFTADEFDVAVKKEGEGDLE